MNYIAYIRDENGVPHPILSLQGLSAYQTWLKQPGNEGKTEQDFLADIKGEPGGIENIEGSTVDFVEATSRTNIATGETITTLFGKIKKWFTDLKGLAFKDKVDYNNDIENTPTSLPASDVKDWAKAATKPSYSYSEITNTPSIPTKVSELTNDKSFQTADQVTTAIAALVNGSPEALDTLQELADALGNDPNFSTTILNKVGQKANKTIVKSATLISAHWVVEGDAYKYVVSDQDIAVETKTVKVTPSQKLDRTKMQDAGVDSLTYAVVGSLTIYSENAPTEDINIIYTIAQ